MKSDLSLVVGGSASEVEPAVPLEPAEGVDGVDPAAHLPHVQAAAARHLELVHSHVVVGTVGNTFYKLIKLSTISDN